MNAITDAAHGAYNLVNNNKEKIGKYIGEKVLGKNPNNRPNPQEPQKSENHSAHHPAPPHGTEDNKNLYETAREKFDTLRDNLGNNPANPQEALENGYSISPEEHDLRQQTTQVQNQTRIEKQKQELLKAKFEYENTVLGTRRLVEDQIQQGLNASLDRIRNTAAQVGQAGNQLKQQDLARQQQLQQLQQQQQQQQFQPQYQQPYFPYPQQ